MPPLATDSAFTDGTAATVDICHCLALRKATRHVTQFYDRELRDAGLNANRYSILMTLVRCDSRAVALRKLADMLVVERSVLGRNLRALERRRWITIAAPEQDRRERQIVLTPAGLAQVLRAKAAWQRAQERFVESVGVDESRLLRQLLAKAKSASFAQAASAGRLS